MIHPEMNYQSEIEAHPQLAGYLHAGGWGLRCRAFRALRNKEPHDKILEGPGAQASSF